MGLRLVSIKFQINIHAEINFFQLIEKQIMVIFFFILYHFLAVNLCFFFFFLSYESI